MKIKSIKPISVHHDGWLKERFGDHFAQISVDTTLKLKMAVKDVARMTHSFVPEDVEEWCKRFEMPPQGVTDFNFVMGYKSDEGWKKGSIEYDKALQAYVAKYPSEWEIVKKCLGLSRQKSRHACAYVIANRPIHEFIPLTTVSDVQVTQYTAGAVEAMGGLKMDFLVINSLNDISDCIKMVQKRSGVEIPDVTVIGGRRVPGHRLLPVQGQLYDIWDLPEDQAVLKDVAEGKTETVFQFNTPGAVQWLAHFNHTKPNGNKAIDSVLAMAAFTALDRPGPLDVFVTHPNDINLVESENTKKRRHNMLVEYARRARGEAPSPDVLAFFNELLPETYGVMVYQEQLQRVYQYLTGCSGADAEEFRSDVAKKKKSKIEKAYPLFIEKASAKIGEKQAQEAWQFIQTWAAYGFNKSHAVCYSVIGYACAYLKHHFPLEWWCAVLRNADKVEINENFWKYCGKHIDLPDVKLSGDQFEIQGDRIRAPINLLQGIGETAHKQLCQYRPYTDINDFCAKIQKHKQDTGTWVEVDKDSTKTDKVTKVKTVTTKKVPKLKLGHSALNRKVIYTLIVSGAMDSLFPETTTNSKGEAEDVLLSDRLKMFEAAYSAASGKKKVLPVDEAYQNVNVVERYQMKKAVLPAYGDDIILPYLHRIRFKGISLNEDGHYTIRVERQAWNGQFMVDDTQIAGFVSVSDMEDMERKAADNPAIFTPVLGACVAYVESTRLFKYGDDRSACEFHFDIAGAKLKAVKWFGKKTPPPLYREKLKGAVVVSLFSKYKADRVFAIDDVFLVQPPLNHESEESPEPEKESASEQATDTQ